MSRRHRRRRAAGWTVLAAAAVATGVLLWNRGDEGVEAPPPMRPDITLEVLNGCGVPGAADRAATELRRAGYPVERVGDGDTYHHRRDLVVVRRGDGTEAPVIAAVLGGAAVIEQRIADYPYELTVVVGTPHPLVPPR